MPNSATHTGHNGHTGHARFAELDGLRALAVLSVILFHCEISGFVNAGFLGVDIFFTISGFIITSILLKEYRREGSFGFLNFYFRRIKRLMPPVLVLILAAYGVTMHLSPSALGAMERDLPAAVFYLSNWWQIVDLQDYFDNTPHVLKHLWSLAVEEQFYIVWPPVAYWLLRRSSARTVGTVALLLAVSSAAWMAWLYELNSGGDNQNRIYLGTDTHAMGLLLGAALACFWNPWAPAQPAPKRRYGARLLALAALAALLHLIQADPLDPVLYRGVFLLVPALTCVVILVTMREHSFFVSAILRDPFVQWIGSRSYSLYLVHWPVFVWMRLRGHEDFSDPIVLAAALGIVAALSELLYRAVESHAMVFDLKNSGALPKAMAIGAYVVIAGLASWGAHNQVTLRDSALGATPSAVVELAPLPVPADDPATAGDTPAAPVTGALLDTSVDTSADTSADAATGSVADAVANPVADPLAEADIESGAPISGGENVYVIGDSVLLGARQNLVKSIPGIRVDAVVGRQASQGAQVVRQWRQKGGKASTVLVHLGTNGYITESHYRDMLRELADRKTVIVVTVRANRRWTAPNNEILRRLAHEFPNVRLLDWNALSESRSDFFVKDGIHLTGKGIHALTARIKTATGGTPLPSPPAGDTMLARAGKPAGAPRSGAAATQAGTDAPASRTGTTDTPNHAEPGTAPAPLATAALAPDTQPHAAQEVVKPPPASPAVHQVE